MIASAREALEIEGLRWHSRFCLAASIAGEQLWIIGHFDQF